MAKIKIDPSLRANAIAALRKRLKHGQTIYTLVRHRMRNGIGGVVSVLIAENDQIQNISGIVSDVLVRHWDDRDGIVTSSDFALVQELSYALHGHESKGDIDESKPHRKATPRKFKAGYTFEHERL